jgi:hypothetical protein
MRRKATRTMVDDTEQDKNKGRQDDVKRQERLPIDNTTRGDRRLTRCNKTRTITNTTMQRDENSSQQDDATRQE